MKNNVKITYALFAIALLVFAFTELQISQAVFGENNAFGNLFETFGEVPMMLVKSLLMCIHDSYKEKEEEFCEPRIWTSLYYE